MLPNVDETNQVKESTVASAAPSNCNSSLVFQRSVMNDMSPRLPIPSYTEGSTMQLGVGQSQDCESVDQMALYKELKYYRINTFNRLVMFLLCLLVPSVFCEVFSIGSTEWFVVTNHVQYHSLGFFANCRNGVLDMCMNLTGPIYARVVQNRHTGEVLCELPDLFVRNYLIAMWSLGITHLLCMVFSLIVTLRIACRPTRSKASLIVMCLLLIALPCGITNCVLFHYYTACDQRSCEALFSAVHGCTAKYEWGFDVYIATICLNFCACITAFCLWTYPYSIRSESSRLWETRMNMEMQTSHERDVSSSSVRKNEGSGTMNRFLRSIRGDSGNPLYLTAVELGVTIEGANDWVYDDKSDFFYSFKLDMFWDPLTRCYYSCRLQSWQVTPQGLLGGLRETNITRLEG